MSLSARHRRRTQPRAPSAQSVPVISTAAVRGLLAAAGLSTEPALALLLTEGGRGVLQRTLRRQADALERLHSHASLAADAMQQNHLNPRLSSTGPGVLDILLTALAMSERALSVARQVRERGAYE